MPDKKTRPDICDYEGSNYRTEFWENQGREYEDRVERVALRRLLPPKGGKRLLEVGAGFGRLTEEYNQYEQVILLDYSFSQMQYAQEHHGVHDRFIYVAADAYRLPFRDGIFDGASMIRTIHHMSHVDQVLAQVRRVLATDGTFILEHANKQNFKAMLRFAMKQQEWSPYTQEPVEFVELNFDFHPQFIVDALKEANFKLKKRIPVSFFRVGSLKENLPVNLLVSLDSILQWTGLLYTPSVFTKSVAIGEGKNNVQLRNIDDLFICPETGENLERDGDTMVNRKHGLRYAIRDGIFDFKAPID